MKLISHRGNINGRIIEEENNPQYIDGAILLGYDVEIDFWILDGEFYLGHDEPKYQIEFDFIDGRSHKLWVHCKNIEAIERLNRLDSDINYFWHQEDTLTLTSKGYVWAHVGKQPIKNSIVVLPEINNDPVSQCYGICSDFIKRYTQ